mgnify:CR=1 FL=1|tara:strand:- start:145 stop:459 length:315 start_codon:yes stop_codon:yes gene_type:complete
MVERPSDEKITSEFPLTTVVQSFVLWHKWTQEGRPHTKTDVGELVYNMLWEMMISWVNVLSDTVERREVVSEFLTSIVNEANNQLDAIEEEVDIENYRKCFKGI